MTRPTTPRARAERELKKYFIRASERGIEVRKPTREVTMIKWEELRTILIQAHEPVPGLPSMMWILSGDNAVCVVPEGARGEESFVKWIEQLPKFRSDELATAKSSREEKTFTIWERPAANANDNHDDDHA
jgi:hypothetical protein